MKNIELERAWPAPKAPPGFTDRVVERLQRAQTAVEPRAPGPGQSRKLTPLRSSWLALPILALVLGAVLLLWLVPPATSGDVVAAEALRISIGERIVAEMSPGAHLRWSGADAQEGASARQDGGAVTYRVVPGTRFRVDTPYGRVAVLGTVFRVLVADRDGTGGGTMKKKWAIAGAGAGLGALVWVNVESGSVGLNSGGRELVLGAGQAGFIGSDGVPRAVAETPAPSLEPRGATPRRPSVPRPITKDMEERRRRVLETAAQVRRPAAGSAAGAGASVPATADEQGMKDRTGNMGAEVQALNQQLMPLVGECFDQAQDRGVRGRGMLALAVKLTGADGIGRIIESVEPAPGNAIDDPELIDCVRQSAFTVDLPPPTSSGSSELEMTIPFEGAADAGAPVPL